VRIVLPQGVGGAKAACSGHSGICNGHDTVRPLPVAAGDERILVILLADARRLAGYRIERIEPDHLRGGGIVLFLQMTISACRANGAHRNAMLMAALYTLDRMNGDSS
jgi:hypothetical protein